jgi:hypothetical protein
VQNVCGDSSATNQKLEMIAGVAMGSPYRYRGLRYRTTWDDETLTEFLRYRRHNIPVNSINSKTDIDGWVLRHFEKAQLSCRRKVMSYVLRRRYFCRYYDSPEVIRMVDCSFKYTGSAYAFQKAIALDVSDIPCKLPEPFFKKAGQKVRERAYAGWLRDNNENFYDMAHSLQDASQDQILAIKSWSDLERHSQQWHQSHINGTFTYSEQRFSAIPAEIPQSIELGKYLFTMLDSPAAMAAEGSEMHHCLASYIRHVPTYFAYKVDGPQRATVGIMLDANGRWQFEQARGKYNAKPSKSLLRNCAELMKAIQQVGQETR